MQKDQKAETTRRIDLSNCKLISPYGRNGADILKVGAKVGTGAGSKVGFAQKTGLISKTGVFVRTRSAR